jgi:YHS domain-containing protein
LARLACSAHDNAKPPSPEIPPWLYRNRDRLGAANRYAIDPVCGMQVEKTAAPARASAGDASYWFCSDQCRDRIDSEPARVAGSVTS